MLQTLVLNNDIGFALSTGNWKKTAKLRLNKAGIGNYFRCGGFAEDGSSKTEILGKALEKCTHNSPGIRRERDIVSVGDRPSDAEAALTHGVPFIGINRNEHIFDGLDVKYIFQDYLDLDKFIETVDKIWNREV